MSSIYRQNKIIYSVFFIILNSLSLLLYFYFKINHSNDLFSIKFSEFLYLINFFWIFLLIRFFKLSIFSPQGLFFISLCLFCFGRVFFSFLGIYHNNYELYWGELFYLDLNGFYFSLIFWQISASSFMLGSMALSTSKQFDFSLIKSSSIFSSSFRLISYSSIVILFVLWFPISYNLILNFLSVGYEGLYEGQGNYNFGIMRVSSLLLPIMIASSVLSGKKIILNYAFVILSLYILTNLIVGQRALLFMWLLIGIWLYSFLGKRKIPTLKIVVLGVSLMIFAQFLESFRGGRLDFFEENPIIKFVYVQSLTYILPSIVQGLDGNWPFLTYVTMFIPVAGLSSILGLVTGSQNFSSGAFFAYTLNHNLFENGFGLGWSVFLDMYLVANKNIFLLSLFCFMLGVLYCLLIEGAKRSKVFLYLLISSLPAFLFSPRSLMYSITSSVIYAFIILVFFLIIFKALSRK